jgi:chitinase
MRKLKKRLLSAACLLVPVFAEAQNTCREVVGYYAGWQWYDRNKLMNPKSVPYKKYSILNYAFFQPQSDGSIKISDPWGDKNQLLGPINWATAPAGYDTQYDFGNPAYHQPNQRLSDYAHQGGCKLLVSVGGWTYSANFPGIAANAAYRAKFAHDCVQMVELYGLDGVDVDWEYPSGNTEKQNFTILLRQVRDSLDALESRRSVELMLTIAVGAAPARMLDVEWSAVTGLVDIVNLMSYDYYGSWDKLNSHNAPLYPVKTAGQPGFSVSESVNNLLAKGVPANKITAGVAFYGRSQTSATKPALYAASTGNADLVNFAADEGTPLYYNILKALPNFEAYWDSTAAVPYLIGKQANTFVSYDDEQSMEQKALFVNSKNLRGVIIWEISGDMIESTVTPGTIERTPLVDRLNTVFCSGSTSSNHAIVPLLAVYPNPTGADGVVYVRGLQQESVLCRVFNPQGQMVKQDFMSRSGQYAFNLSELKRGCYWMQFHTDAGTVLLKLIR